MDIILASKSSEILLQAINKLLPQLSAMAKPLSEKELIYLIDSESNQLVLATEKEEIYGMLSLVTCKLPTGKKALVEDLVVDGSVRDKGIGKMLLNKAIELAKDQELRYIDLTSNPLRKEANALYQKLGFEKRETNVYRFHL